MPKTEAAKRAERRYKRKAREKGRVRSVTVEFYGTDADLFEFVQRNKPVATYLKALLRAEMEREDDGIPEDAPGL